MSTSAATAAAARAAVFAEEASAAAARAVAAAGEAAAAVAELEGWQVVVGRSKKKSLTADDIIIVDDASKINLAADAPPFEPKVSDEIKLFETSNQMEALFLMGIGGRNVSLIRKHTGIAIYIRDGGGVWMMDRNRWPANAKPQKAWGMVLSACCGGILRWFATPAATQKWYSHLSAPVLKAAAERSGCALELLRSRTGHMCLILVPHSALLFDSPNATTPTAAGVASVRATLPVVREEMMCALASLA
jgi:hypothetical protein